MSGNEPEPSSTKDTLIRQISKSFRSKMNNETVQPALGSLIKGLKSKLDATKEANKSIMQKRIDKMKTNRLQREKEEHEEEEMHKLRKEIVKPKPPVPKAVIPVADDNSSSPDSEIPVDKPDSERNHMRGVFA